MQSTSAAPAALLAAALVLLGLPAASAADVRHAAPAGVSLICSEPAPCSLRTAVESAAVGDEVVLAPGEYPPLASDLNAVAQLDVHGASRSPRAVIVLSGAARVRLDGGERLSDVDVVSSGWDSAVTINGGATAERVRIAVTATSAYGAEIYTGSLLDSSVLASGPTSVAVQTLPNGLTVTATLRNDTILAPGRGSVAYSVAQIAASGGTTANVANTILLGEGTDLATSSGGGSSTVDVNLDHDNLTSTTGLPGHRHDLGGNQSGTPPLLVNVASGDLHQLPSSPTVDAGLDADANGSLDVDGDARRVGATDIGADELVPPPPDPPVPGGGGDGTGGDTGAGDPPAALDPGASPLATPPPATPSTPGAQRPPSTRALAARLARRGATVRRHLAGFVLTCAKRAPAGCRGVLVLRIGRTRLRPLRYRLKAGARRGVGVRLTRAQEARLRQAGRAGLRATVTLVTRGAPVRVVLRRG
jgi:hypothetical protein